MHSFIIVGSNKKLIDQEVSKIVEKSKSQLLKFELKKIEDVRSLIKYTKLKVAKPSAILIYDIDKATSEALNAFLKNLEEPQKNITYILTATSQYSLLPTITSRCQIIKVKSGKGKLENENEINKFLKSSQSGKLLYFSKITKREEAVKFFEDLIIFLDNQLEDGSTDHLKIAKCLKYAQETLSALQKNANVTLQLTNFVIALKGANL